MSLRWRLALLSSLVTFLALAVLAVSSGLALQRVRIFDLDGELDAQAQAVLDASHDHPLSGLSDQVESSLTLETGTSAARLYRAGRLVWQGGARRAPATLDPIALAVSGRDRCSCNDWRVRTLVDAASNLKLTVQVGRSLRGISDTLTDYARIAALGTILATTAAGLLAAVFVGQALRPLERLVSRVSSLDSDAAIPGLGEPTEIGALARALQGSLERLRETRELEARFLADASHELRTPVTALAAGLEHTLERPRSPQENRAAVQLAWRQAIHLRELAINLLALSRSKVAPPARVRLDLLELAGEATDRLMPLAVDKNLTLDVDGEPSLTEGDPVLLARVIENLISNAIRYTTRGAVSVRVQPAAGGNWVMLTVADTGPGIPAAERVRLLEPFQRGAHGNHEGFGLGLAVVQSIVGAHGGQLELSERPGGGAVAAIRLPAALRPPT